jgi:hypothetical protein
MRSARSHLRPITNSRLRVLIHQWTISSVLTNIEFSENTVRATCEENVEVPQFGSPDVGLQLNEPYFLVSSRKRNCESWFRAVIASCHVLSKCCDMQFVSSYEREHWPQL